MTVKSSISLSAEQHAFARAQVRQGRFPSVSAVVQHGLELLREKSEGEMADRAALKALLEERARGAFVDVATMRSRLKDMTRARRRTDRNAD
ncbi:type II toxin-antitoxin system ParD family antitoxin [Paracoccus sp. WLY502]|uniref:ribbon-helix-helix domain-containing protein n=1 Tax=Paracoccus yibinensis TaxID=3068891 RepID=UPI0027969D05|nr:type II toxin-antitoxin system ParD family antitoxin [Paracoccus sp. WLY502]MDQ1902845.1 type II toxin-antitoxin system ParD family antitoxin [Paracoccus sp. WLY502]